MDWARAHEFSGPIPASLVEAEALIELQLERNQFSGELPPAPPPAFKSFDVSTTTSMASSRRRSEREQGIRSVEKRDSDEQGLDCFFFLDPGMCM